MYIEQQTERLEFKLLVMKVLDTVIKDSVLVKLKVGDLTKDKLLALVDVLAEIAFTPSEISDIEELYGEDWVKKYIRSKLG